ncbi:molybdenum cofactor guanylyltransferase [Cohnella endophytica]|nr:molybdenum cofactor guanylyltransferase [Cohnella endophytica]
MGDSSGTVITGAILAGGMNSVLAEGAKALLPLGGETLIERQVREMRKLCAEVIVVTNTPKLFFRTLDPSVRIITDFFPDCGPLGGIHSALYLARNSTVWIAGCDMPFLSSEAAKWLAGNRTSAADAVIPIVHGQPAPLHGIYDKRCAQVAARLLAAGERGLGAFLGSVCWLGMSEETRTKREDDLDYTFAIRDQKDYEQAKQLLMASGLTGAEM